MIFVVIYVVGLIISTLVGSYYISVVTEPNTSDREADINFLMFTAALWPMSLTILAVILIFGTLPNMFDYLRGK